MNNLPDHIYFKDNESRFLRISKSHSEFFNLDDPAQAIGKTDFDFFDKEHASAAYKNEQEIIQTGQSLTIEEKETLHDRSVSYVTTTKMPFHDKAGNIVGTFGISRDITERKKAEEERSRLAHIIETTSDFVAIAGIDQNFVYMNKAGREMTGYGELEDLSSKSITDFVTEDTLKILGEIAIPTAMQTGKWSGETTLLTKTGTEIPIWSVTIVHKTPDGRPEYISTIARDLTERKKAEADMISMEQRILDQKIQEQKHVARAIIKAQERERNHMGQELHDNVNQILAGTKLYLGMIGKDDKTKQDIKYPMELIDNAINEIRLISHKNVTPQKNINLMDLLQSLINDLEENTTLKTVLKFDLDGEIEEDDLKLNIYRIIQEQVNNILKHAAAKNVSISVQAIDNSIQVITTDDGKGFDLNKTRKGIGILNMMNRIETFNGNMKIISSPGHGCKIDITIPY